MCERICANISSCLYIRNSSVPFPDTSDNELLAETGPCKFEEKSKELQELVTLSLLYRNVLLSHYKLHTYVFFINFIPFELMISLSVYHNQRDFKMNDCTITFLCSYTELLFIYQEISHLQVFAK